MKKLRSTLVLQPLAGSRLLTEECASMLEELRFMFMQAQVPFSRQWLAGYDQAQARDELLAYFWNCTDFDQALFVDNDMRVDPRYLLQLCSLEEGLVCIPYEMRNSEHKTGLSSWAIDTIGEQSQAEEREGVQMMPLAGAGMGVMRVRRDALGKMASKFGAQKSLNWTSHYDRWAGLPVTGYCNPLVTEHPEGSGIMRRRPEDMSFAYRAAQAGVKLWALIDVPVWHDTKGGRSLRDAWQDEERRAQSLRKRAHAELAECPDDLLGLVEVLDGSYDVAGLEFDEPPVILDVGANIGAAAIFFAKRYPGAAITCYEPHPEMANLCRKNTGEGAWPVISVQECAVVGGVEDLPVKLYDGKHNQGERTIHPVTGMHEDTFTYVPTTSARKLPPCDILKVDTEGCEVEILSGYTHWDAVTAVMLEWHSVEDYKALRKMMGERGFVCMVDRARGRPSEHRELCFVRKGYMTAGVAKNQE
jgi:FkbM family methyltransferase